MKTKLQHLALSVKLYKQVRNQTDVISCGIARSMENKDSIDLVFKTIIEQAEEDEATMVKIITKDILNEIRKTVLL